MKLSMIAAIGEKNELGKDNDLLWYLPNDLKFFKQVTTGKTILMGRKTFESLPKLLPNRKHIVLSKYNNEFPNEVTVYKNKEDFINDYKATNEEIFVIGGGAIYKLFINDVSDIYLTEVDANDNTATVYFPNFNKEEFNRELIDEDSYNNISFKHVLYRRK